MKHSETLKAFDLLTHLFWLISTMTAVMLSHPSPSLAAMSVAQQSSSRSPMAVTISAYDRALLKVPLYSFCIIKSIAC